MNDPLIAVRKLEDLARLAVGASTDFEKAAIYAATTALSAELKKACQRASENIERARWSICAIVGYDVTNGHPPHLHLSWALGALTEIAREFR